MNGLGARPTGVALAAGTFAKPQCLRMARRMAITPSWPTKRLASLRLLLKFFFVDAV